MTEPIELKFSLNYILYHIPASKFSLEKLICSVVGLQHLKNDPETPIFTDFHGCSTGGSIFHCVLLKTTIMYSGKPYPQHCLTSAVRWYHGFGRFSVSDRQTRF